MTSATASRTPLVGASALHGVSGTFQKPLGPQPLGPGRAVLTWGVSRRSGSVAYIRADASPTEVLTSPMVTPTATRVKPFTQPLRKVFVTCGRFAFADTVGPRLGVMANTLQAPEVATVLDRMYTEAKNQMPLLLERRGDFDRPMTAQERAEAMSEFYIPVTPEAGRLLYALVRATRPTTIVEFGMSFGISALHLAAAVRDNGTGRVLTTELNTTKIAAAKQTFADTGLDDLITVLEGDALSTLADVAGPVNFVLLDGWKDLYLPVLELLEPRLSVGALVVADNTNAADTQPYLDRVRNPDNGYVSFNFAVRDSDSMEISCSTGG